MHATKLFSTTAGGQGAPVNSVPEIWSSSATARSPSSWGTAIGRTSAATRSILEILFLFRLCEQTRHVPPPSVDKPVADLLVRCGAIRVSISVRLGVETSRARLAEMSPGNEATALAETY